MLPAYIMNNPHIRSYVVMPIGALDVLQQEERWERKPHSDDKPASKGSPPIYYGEWENKTAIAQAEWEVRKAELELIKLERQERNRKLIERKITEEDESEGED